MSLSQKVGIFMIVVFAAILFFLWLGRYLAKHDAAYHHGAIFPLNPTSGQLFTHRGRVWCYDGKRCAWKFERLEADYVS